MNQLSRVFQYHGFQVRIVIRNEETWWVGKDICEVLGLSDPRKSISSLDEDERIIVPVTDSLGREQPTYVINEAGLYSLIIRSRKPEAKDFKRWITHEVLPSIRKTGVYSTTPTSIEDLIIMQAQSVKELKNEVNRLKEEHAVVNHRINLMDRTDIVGDEQQRFNKMIRKFAWKNGIRFDQAYRDFKGAFNIAYRTNITAVHENYMARHGKCTLPEFLVATGRIEDALRVVDKMLNQEEMSYG